MGNPIVQDEANVTKPDTRNARQTAIDELRREDDVISRIDNAVFRLYVTDGVPSFELVQPTPSFNHEASS